MIRDFIQGVMKFSNQMRKQNVGAYAASIAFFFFLSLVPILMMICTLIPYTPVTEQDFAKAVQEIVPDVVAPLVLTLISDVYEKSSGILSIAIIATIWSASKGFMALMQGLNAVNGVEEKRNYFVIRLIASFYTVFLMVVVLLSLILNVFGNQLLAVSLYYFPQLKELVNFAMNFRFIVVWILMTILFATIYTFVPNQRLHFLEQIPGAAFSSVVWSVYSWGFSIYITYYNSYGVYGSLSLIIIALLWMYFCMYIVMIGASLNLFFRPVTADFIETKKQKKKTTEAELGKEMKN